MTKKRTKSRAELPLITDFPVQMNNANEEIEIYSGDFIIELNEDIVEVSGRLTFKWLPTIGARFSGIVQSGAALLFPDNLTSNYNLIIEGLSVGTVFITNTHLKDDREHPEIKGVFNYHSLRGDGSIAVDRIDFAIPNLKSFIGATATAIDENRTWTGNVRTFLEDDNYEIILDKAIDYNKRNEELNEKGGYLLLYSGSLKKKKGSILLVDGRDVFLCLNTFITFLQGSRITTVFHSGIYQNQVIWTDFSNYNINNYKTGFSWTLYHSNYGLCQLYGRFSSIWKSESPNKDFLISVIHWYIESNNNSGYTEGSIIMSQVALELIYNWLIIEKNALLLGKDAANISSANKIRLILSKLNISSAVPESMTYLAQYVAEESEINDAPDCITIIRNALVHSQIEKRLKVSRISIDVKYEALQVSLWYIELSVLYILGYDGKYSNRCIRLPFPLDREMDVPWKA